MSKPKINVETCKGCALCVAACPKKVLRLAKDTLNTKGYHPCELFDPDGCISCAMCATMCPDVAITLE